MRNHADTRLGLATVWALALGGCAGVGETPTMLGDAAERATPPSRCSDGRSAPMYKPQPLVPGAGSDHQRRVRRL